MSLPIEAPVGVSALRGFQGWEGTQSWGSLFLRFGQQPADQAGAASGLCRLGQGTFRMPVTDSYQRRCAVTGEKALPVLDAAHILPVGKGGQHRLDNSLLLRTDVHRLYDKGYVTVTPDGHFLVSRRLKDDFDNGEPYMPFHGQRIWMPGDPGSQPNRETLEWHAEGVFWG